MNLDALFVMPCAVGFFQDGTDRADEEEALFLKPPEEPRNCFRVEWPCFWCHSLAAAARICPILDVFPKTGTVGVLSSKEKGTRLTTRVWMGGRGC